MSSSTVRQRTFRRAPARGLGSATPSSSMIPVNIQVPFHREFVRALSVQREMSCSAIASARRRRPMPPATAATCRPPRIFGAVVEEDLVHDARSRARSNSASAGFDHQREIFLARPASRPRAQVGAPARAVEDQHLDAARSRSACAAPRRRRRRDHHHIVLRAHAPSWNRAEGAAANPSRCAAAGGCAAARCDR